MGKIDEDKKKNAEVKEEERKTNMQEKKSERLESEEREVKW